MGIDAEMFVRTREALTPRDLRNLSVDAVEAFGTKPFFLMPEADLTGDGDENEWWEPGDPPGRHVLRRIRWWVQDGADIHPEPGEQFIKVSLFSRYYGEGYERGPIHDHIAIARWLEHRIPGGAVWYGGDSSGICAEPFGPAERERVWAHFCTVGHRPYYRSWDPNDGADAPVCGFCGPRLVANGGGRDVTFYYCRGCDVLCARSVATGEVEMVDKRKYGRDDDVFAAGNRLRSRLRTAL